MHVRVGHLLNARMPQKIGDDLRGGADVADASALTLERTGRDQSGRQWSGKVSGGGM